MVIAPCADLGDRLTHRVRGHRHTDSFNFKFSKQVPGWQCIMPSNCQGWWGGRPQSPVVHSLDRQWGLAQKLDVESTYKKTILYCTKMVAWLCPRVNLVSVYILSPVHLFLPLPTVLLDQSVPQTRNGNAEGPQVVWTKT